MCQPRADKPIELAGKLLHALRRERDPDQLHRNELLGIGIVRAKDGSERPGPDLMENAEWSERSRRR
jgi:hypothetical protein